MKNIVAVIILAIAVLAPSQQAHSYVVSSNKVGIAFSAVGTSNTIGGIDFIVTLPPGVTVQADAVTGEVSATVLSTGIPKAVSSAKYTAATSSTPGTVRIVFLAVPTGFNSGEFARLICNAATGSSLDASSFSSSVNLATGLNLGTITGVGVNISLVEDLIPPSLTISTLPNNAVTNNATLNISGNVNDDSGVTSFVINDATVPVAGDGSFSYLLVLKDGANVITTIATDVFGNSTKDTRTISLDTIAPILIITSPNDNSKTNKNIIEVSGSVQDASASVIDIKVNNTPIQLVAMNAGSFSATVNLKEGVNTIDITTTDLAGNITTAKRTVTSDTTTPSLSVNFPTQDIMTLQKNITVNGLISDITSVATVKLTVDGQSYAPQVTNGAFSQRIALSTEKTYSITVAGVDEVGNNSVTVQRNIIYRQPTIDDAMRALKIAVGIVPKTHQDELLNVAPIVNNFSTPDSAIDISDAIALLGKSVGVMDW